MAEGERGAGCVVWARRKRAFCGAETVSGELYCQQHADSHRGRVPCPRDPKHTVLKTRLVSHLRVCSLGSPSLREAPSSLCECPFVRKGCNGGCSALSPRRAERLFAELVPEGAGQGEAALAAREPKTVWELGRRVALCLVALGVAERELGADEAYDGGPTVMLHRIGLRPLEFERGGGSAPPQSDASSGCSASKKHRNSVFDLEQQLSIAGHLLAAQQPGPSSVLVELCAGTGRLARVVCRSAAPAFSRVLLCDKAVFRKDAFRSSAEVTADDADDAADADAGALASPAADRVERVEIDIRDFDLTELLRVRAEAGPVLACGKHLCGAAGDYALRCSARCPAVRRVAFSLCCHHLLDYGDFVGRGFLAERGLAEGEIAVLRKLCTKYRAHPWKEACDVVLAGEATAAAPQLPPSRKGKHPLSTETGRNAAARAEVGILAKRLFNEVRAAWLREEGGWDTVKLVRYVHAGCTPENMLLVASRESGCVSQSC